MLQQLLGSIREQHGYRLRILVADDGGIADSDLLWGAELLALPEGTGLSAGRNALVSATRTPFLAMLDDDVLFHNSTRLDVLLAALAQSPGLSLAAGCYFDIRFSRADCFNLRFATEDNGAVVHAKSVLTSPSGCQAVHATHNFFVARTSVLRRFRWDPRQKMMEHESFFYQLFLNGQQVVACSDVSVVHNTTRDEQYRERSFRLQERHFMQYHCKNFPEVARFKTPYLLWRCDTRSYCSPAWHAQFPYDGSECQTMQWNAAEDKSTVPRPLITPATDFVYRSASTSSNGGEQSGELSLSSSNSGESAHTRAHIPLLVLIFTERANVARREWQRATWLSFRWHRGFLDHRRVPWRHIYVTSRPKPGTAATLPEEEEQMDHIVGDMVTLGNCTEGYENLVYKTMEAIRWAVTRVSFTVMLKVDDDSIVHIGRLWTWLFTELPTSDRKAQSPTRLYAGRVFRGSQVIRSNFTRASLWRPDWFPTSFKKWAVDFDTFGEEAYPPYCGGGGYVLGHDAAARVVDEYDMHYRGGKIIPVEDAFVGVLARAQGITATDALTFQEPPRGLLQTRELFIDQLLVHRVLEPYKAFRWLMLSSNCHAGPYACAVARNRTRGIAYQGVLPNSPDTHASLGAQISFDRDWISDAIPKANPDARTGSAPIYDRPSTGLTERANSKIKKRHGRKTMNRRTKRRERSKRRHELQSARPSES